MNRIYIIGNGFDLSHGLPTSYKDFVEFLIKKEVFTLIDNIPNLFTKAHLNHKYLGELAIKDEEMRFIFKENKQYLKNEEIKHLYNFKNLINNDPIYYFNEYFNKIPDNVLLNQILDSDHFLWGKIEMQYFELLKKYHKIINPDKSNIEDIKNLVTTLNNNLEYIKNELVSYLTYIQKTNKNNYKESNLFSTFDENINQKTIYRHKKVNLDYNEEISERLKDIVEAFSKTKQPNFKDINEPLFLNFNYTETFSYVINRKGFNYSSINIHGNIKESNEIIFGFGDENTNEYKEIENSEDVFLENIKSFKYLKNNNYDHLTSYIDANFYEVYLLGHSCSVTDRVLLKKIFENPNCLTIKIIPRSGNDNVRFENYKEISFNIARIFEDNGMMRDKMISFEDCKISLPNIKKFDVNVFDYIENK